MSRLWRWARPVQVRTMLAATVVVAATLLVVAFALVAVQRAALTSGLKQVAEQEAALVASQISDGGIASVDLAAASGRRGEGALVQVVDATGQVVAASSSIAGEPPVWAAEPSAGQVIVEGPVTLTSDEEEPYAVVTQGVATTEGVVRVITAQSLDSVGRSTAVTGTVVGIAFPVVLIVVAVTVYLLAGRALAPVEAIRRRVSALSAVDVDTRVPVPSSGDEITRLAETMNQMLSRLAHAAHVQHQFVSDASHELRSPLATIRATAELAGAHPDRLGWAEASQVVVGESDRLEHLVDDLLLLAGSDERGPVLNLQEVDLDDVVTAEADRLRRVSGRRVELDIRSVRASADPRHLARAVRNLVDNAARHAAGAVRLRLRAAEGLAVLEVSDDGEGIAPEDREEVFGRFVRLDESRQRGTGGTGLGLAITRDIATAHGGDVRVVDPPAPVPGELAPLPGAHLVLRIPLAGPGGFRGGGEDPHA